MSENKDKERKGVGVGAGVGGNAGGAAPQWMSAAAKVGSGGSGSGFLSFGGAAGKAGWALRVKSILLSKTLMFTASAGGMVFSGAGLKDMNRRGFGVEIRREAAKPFDRRETPRTSAVIVPGTEPSGKSALELAQEANQGTYGAEAGAAADAPAAEDKVEQPEAPEAEGAAAGPDAQALAAQMMENMGEDESSKAKSGLGKKFGSLSRELGGGNSEAKLSGGAGLSGGLTKSFSGRGLSNKALAAMSQSRKSGVSRAKTAARNMGGKHAMGANATKLARMNSAMQGARGQSNAAQSSIHTGQWSGAEGGGRALSGAGGGAADIPDDGGGGGGPMNSPGGGYTGGYNDGYGDSYGGGSVPKMNPVNITPYQQMVDMAQVLLQLASVLLLVAGLLGMWAKKVAAAAHAKAMLATALVWTPAAAAALAAEAAAEAAFAAKLYAMAKYMAYSAAAMAAIVTLLGVGIMMQGQTTQGAIFTGIGALLTTISYVAAESYGTAASASSGASKVAEEGGKAVATKLGTATTTGALSSTGGLAVGGSAVGGIGSPIMEHNAEGWENDYKEDSGYNDYERRQAERQAELDRQRSQRQYREETVFQNQRPPEPAPQTVPAQPAPPPDDTYDGEVT